jgi:hypothetical protein
MGSSDANVSVRFGDHRSLRVRTTYLVANKLQQKLRRYKGSAFGVIRLFVR